MHSFDPHETSQVGHGVAGEGDELVRRLRGLKWTEVDPQLRFRCWEEFSRRLADAGPESSAPGSRAAADRDVYEFSRGGQPRRSTGEPRLPSLLRRVSQGPGGRLDLGGPSIGRRPGLSLAARLV